MTFPEVRCFIFVFVWLFFCVFSCSFLSWCRKCTTGSVGIGDVLVMTPHFAQFQGKKHARGFTVRSLQGFEVTLFLFLSLMKLNYSPADTDLQPACCSNYESKLSADTVTLFATDPITVDPARCRYATYFSLLFLLPLVTLSLFSSVPFDEWLSVLGQMTAYWLIVCAFLLFHLLTSFSNSISVSHCK